MRACNCRYPLPSPTLSMWLLLFLLLFLCLLGLWHHFLSSLVHASLPPHPHPFPKFTTLGCRYIEYGALANFEARDVMEMIAGSEDVDVDDWMKETVYEGYERDSEQVGWFWEVVREMSHQHRRALLKFSTGSEHIPLEGFQGLQTAQGTQRFTIARCVRAILRAEGVYMYMHRYRHADTQTHTQTHTDTHTLSLSLLLVSLQQLR